MTSDAEATEATESSNRFRTTPGNRTGERSQSDIQRTHQASGSNKEPESRSDGESGCSCANRAAPEEETASGLISLDFSVHVSLRYHAHRRAWFDFLHRLTMVLSAVGGSAALGSVLTAGTGGGAGSNTLALTAALVVTIAGATSAAFGLAERARQAGDLYRRFSTLAQKMASHPAPGTTELRTWRAERLLIEADESAIISTLNVLCHNAEATARGYGDTDRYRVYWWQRLFADLMTLPPSEWRPIQAS